MLRTLVGGDLSVDYIRCNDRTKKVRPLADTLSNRPLPFYAAFNIMLNIAVGSDPFWLPYDVQTGVIKFVLMGCGVALLTMISYDLFTKSWQFGQGFDYASIWMRIFGHKAWWISGILILISYMSIISSFSNEAWSNISQIVQSVASSTPSWLTSSWFLGYFAMLICFLCVIYTPNLAGLKVISYIANTAMIVAGVCSIVLFAETCIKDGFDPNGMIILWGNDSDMTINTLSDFSVIFFIHPMIHHVIVHLDCPTIGKALNLAWYTTGFSVAFNILVAISGYFTFWQFSESGNYLYNESDSGHSSLFLVARIASYVKSIGSMSMWIYLMAYEMCEIVQIGGSNSKNGMVIGIVCTCMLAQMMNFWSSESLDILNWAGQLTFYILAFILPPAFYFRSFGIGNWHNFIQGIFVIIAGTALMGPILYFSMASIVESY